MKTRKKWTLNECKEIALQYEKRVDWREGCYRSYTAAKRRPEWMKECTKHMKSRRFWSREECLEIARMYTTIKD